MYLVVGKLRRPHGVQGEIIMEVFTDFPERLRKRQTLYVGEEHRPVQIDTIRGHQQGLIISLVGYPDREAVGTLRNQMLYRKAAEAPQLPEGEYYYHQLIGMRVVDERGKEVGVLSEILETGANDVYLVKNAAGEEVLLPAIEDVILEVDVPGKSIRVRLPEWE
ncbi:MAG: 16S rRNA processing protein RimM [Chloroflexi bacterium]|nr:16S rRNA processing protein RimM [Chloroflexota bacterium]